MSPLKVLTRGYAFVSKDDGSVIKSVHQAKTDDRIVVHLTDGRLNAIVTEKEENQ